MSEERPTARGGDSAWRAAPRSARDALLGFVIVIVLWELVARLIVDFPLILPAPTLVWQALIGNIDLYLRETGFTFFELILGFLAGFILGFVSAVGIYYSRLLSRFLYPLLLGFRIVPKVAFITLFTLWFGIGMGSKVALAAFGIFFLVLVQTLLGLRGLDQTLVELGRSLQMNEKLMFLKLRLPAALPAIMLGVKLGIVYALTLVVVAEMVVGNRGVGWIILHTKARFATAEMLGAIVVIGAAGVALFGLGGWLERRLTFWNIEE